MKYMNRLFPLHRRGSCKRGGCNRDAALQCTEQRPQRGTKLGIIGAMIRNRFAIILSVVQCVTGAGAVPVQKDPASLSARDSHDGLLVAVDPWTNAAQYKARFKKHTPMDAGVAAIDVYFRNDTDKLIRINVDTIRLIYAPPDGDRQKLFPLAPEDVADLVLHPGSAKDPSIPRPRLPIPGRGPKKG